MSAKKRRLILAAVVLGVVVVAGVLSQVPLRWEKPPTNAVVWVIDESYGPPHVASELLWDPWERPRQMTYAEAVESGLEPIDPAELRVWSPSVLEYLADLLPWREATLYWGETRDLVVHGEPGMGERRRRRR